MEWKLIYISNLLGQGNDTNARLRSYAIMYFNKFSNKIFRARAEITLIHYDIFQVPEK